MNDELKVFGGNAHPELTKSITDYLNIPRPQLSREMGLMRDDGIIEFEGSHITVNDALKLEKSIQ